MAGKIKGVITDQQVQTFLKGLYEENVAGKMLKAMKEAYEEEYRYDDCPYCHKPYNIGKGQRMGEFPEMWIISECPHCKKEVWTKIEAFQDGDMFEGTRYETRNKMYMKEYVPKKALELDTGERHYGDQEDVYLNAEKEKTEKPKPDNSPIIKRFKT